MVKLFHGMRKTLPYVVVVVLSALMMVVIGVGSFREVDKLVIARIKAEETAQTNLIATALKERLDRIVDVSAILANQEEFRKMIQAGQWDETRNILATFPLGTDIVQRIFLVDKTGTIKLPIPDYPGLTGTNLAYRDWYKGVMSNNNTYVSEVFKSLTANNVVMIVVPIRPIGSEKDVLALLTIQIDAQTIQNWLKEFNIKEDQFIYIADQYGHIVAHTHYSPQADILSVANHDDFIDLRKTGDFLIEFSEQGRAGIPGEEQPHIGSSRFIGKYNWSVFITEYLETGMMHGASAKRFVITAILIGMLILSTIGCLLVYVFRRLKTSLNIENSLIKNIGDALIVIDRNWNIQRWNKATEELTGYQLVEVMGKPLRQYLKLIRESDRKENMEFIERAIVKGESGVLENRTVIVRKDGSEIPVGDSAAPLIESGGVITGAIILMRDATKERETLSMRSDFTYASHQLQTPITKALWSLELLRKKSGMTEFTTDIDTAYESMRSIQKMSDQLLIITRIDQKFIVPDLKNIRLSQSFDELLDFLNKTIEKSGNKIVVQIEPISATLGTVIDPVLLKVALIEILDNAIKYNKPNGKINLKTELLADHLLITIEDSGIGIVDEQKPLIFTKFFRGSNFDTTNIIGAGLGLFIAREYIKLLNGKIWFDSQADKGTTFFVEIPIH